MLIHGLLWIIFTVTNKKPAQASITKVKQFEGSASFVRRSQWMLEQLRQVNGIDPHRVSILSCERFLFSAVVLFLFDFSITVRISFPMRNPCTSFCFCFINNQFVVLIASMLFIIRYGDICISI